MCVLSVPSRLWRTWSSPTWSPTSRVPVSWPCAARCAPTPPVERPRPSSPTRNSHRQTQKHTHWCPEHSRAPCEENIRPFSINTSFIHAHLQHTQFLQHECQWIEEWRLQMLALLLICWQIYFLIGTKLTAKINFVKRCTNTSCALNLNYYFAGININSQIWSLRRLKKLTLGRNCWFYFRATGKKKPCTSLFIFAFFYLHFPCLHSICLAPANLHERPCFSSRWC